MIWWNAQVSGCSRPGRASPFEDSIRIGSSILTKDERRAALKHANQKLKQLQSNGGMSDEDLLLIVCIATPQTILY